MRSKTRATTEAPIRLQEKHYQQRLRDYALTCHWLYFHDYHALWNGRGLPDNILCREGCGGRPGRLVVAEIKVKGGRFSSEQKQWLAALKTVQGIEVYSWVMPDDWEEAVRILR